MNTFTTPRIGFACKFSELDPKKGIIGIPECNCGGTTVAWLGRQTREVAEQKLWDLMVRNITAVYKLVEKVGTLDAHLRMVRIGSEVLPVFTHRDWIYFWHRSDVVEYCERNFRAVGDLARLRDVRLSFHPGQFTVLASENDEIVDRSIQEFEYHASMARWMGYGSQFQDFKINVHISGRRGPAGIKSALQRLTPEARNCITIENDENTWGIDASLELADHCALVLDVHHHWLHSGSYIQATDDRIARIVDSWRGVRPVIHYSQSREDYLVDHDSTVLSDFDTLLASGYKKQKLRAHSDFLWNQAANQYALSHWSWADIMVEAKAKNLASFALAQGLELDIVKSIDTNSSRILEDGCAQ
jgi:UV DNA damage repair endonuclease